MERIDRIVIAEDNVKANLRRTICNKCGRTYFMAMAKDGSTVQPCPVCLGVFGNEEVKNGQIHVHR